jgi:hypothetical protein
MQNPKQLANVKKTVMAGMKLMYSETGRQYLINGMKKKEPMPQKLATEVLGVISLLFDRSGQTMPPDAIPGAVAILIYEVAAFMQEAGLKVSKDDVQQGLQIAMKNLIPMLREQRKSKPLPPGDGQPQQGQPQPQPAQPQGGMIQQARM